MEVFHEVNGFGVPIFVTQERVDSLRDFPLRADDVWVVSFPKSGTTWTQIIVKLIRSGGEDDGKAINQSQPWLEAFNDFPGFAYNVDLDTVPTPRTFKSHFSYDSLPCGRPNTTPCKYIYVARNPKDAYLSGFHHLKLMGLTGVEWSQISGMFLQKPEWFDHVLQFWAHKDDDNVLFLKYEDMKKDLPSAVATIAKFIGCNLTQEMIEDIATKSGFENVKKKAVERAAEAEGVEGTPASHHDIVSKPGFYRKGVIGDWKNYFTPEQSAQFDAIYAERMKGTGLEFDFE